MMIEAKVVKRIFLSEARADRIDQGAKRFVVVEIRLHECGNK